MKTVTKVCGKPMLGMIFIQIKHLYAFRVSVMGNAWVNRVTVPTKWGWGRFAYIFI